MYPRCMAFLLFSEMSHFCLPLSILCLSRSRYFFKPFCMATVYFAYGCRNRHYSYICYEMPNPHRVFFLFWDTGRHTESPCVTPIPLVGYWVLGPETHPLCLQGLWCFCVTTNKHLRMPFATLDVHSNVPLVEVSAIRPSPCESQYTQRSLKLPSVLWHVFCMLCGCSLDSR